MDSRASPFTQSKDLLFACAAGLPDDDGANGARDFPIQNTRALFHAGRARLTVVPKQATRLKPLTSAFNPHSSAFDFC